MAEYIERESTCKDCAHYDICIFHHKVNENKECVHFKNKADVVEVVRCKDCKHIRGIGCGWGYCYLLSHYTVVSLDDFCKHGAKMDGKGDE